MKDLINKIHLGDCMEFMKQLPDKSIDLVLTDPPFGMDFQSSRRADKYKKIEGDNDLHWLKLFAFEIDRVLKTDGQAFVFCSWHKVDVFKRELEKFFKIKNMLVWVKNNHGSGDLYSDFAPQHELIIFINKENKFLLGKRDSNVLNFQKTDNSLHPTQKPTDLIGYLASKTIEKGIVLDCFSGSGTTALVCHDLGLDFICIEKDPDYHAASVKRLEEHQRQGRLF